MVGSDLAPTLAGTRPPEERARALERLLEQYWFGDNDPERPKAEACRSAAAAAAIAAGLKPFPAVASHVLALAVRPETPVRELTRAIERDPALAARLLRVANSAAFRARSEIRDIDEAIVRLGHRSVCEVVIGVASLGLFNDTRGVGRVVRDHSAAVASLARLMAGDWYGGQVGNVYVYGLMHDLGKLLSLQVGEVPYEQLDATILESFDLLHIHERFLVGYDHAVLGACVLDGWQLPADITQVVAWHHQPGRAYQCGGDISIAVALIRLADCIDYQLRVTRKPDQQLWLKLSRDGAARYAGFSADYFQLTWPRLVAARDDALKVFREE